MGHVHAAASQPADPSVFFQAFWLDWSGVFLAQGSLNGTDNVTGTKSSSNGRVLQTDTELKGTMPLLGFKANEEHPQHKAQRLSDAPTSARITCIHLALLVALFVY